MDEYVAANVVAVAEEKTAVLLFRLVIVADAEVRLEVEAVIAMRLEIVVVASADVPVAVNVPVTKLDVVALVAVRLVKKEVTAVKKEVKKLMEDYNTNIGK